jgi:tetratricopeptide (TPR) repeat protein
VVYEHTPEHEAVGTIRVFESLPLFSGRSTLEGLYMQGSPTAPFVFYLQSEISTAGSCPFPDWGCARLDLAKAVRHLRMMNVSEYIVRSAPVKAAAAKEPGLEREAVIGPYELYRVRDNDGRYAIPLARAPMLIQGDGWKEMAYRWFKHAGPDDVVPVFAAADTVSPDERARFAGASDDLPATAPVRELGPLPALRETMEPERITVEGCTPGHPVLIRISYHPRWRATTGERVWLAGPSFMLVFPKGDRVELAYDGGPPVTLGLLFSVTGWVLFALAVLPFGRGLESRVVAAGARLGEVRPIRPVVAWVRRTATWSPRVRYALLAGILGVVVAAYASAAVTVRGTDADTLYRRGQELYGAGKLEAALPLFLEAKRLAPLSATAIHSSYFSSIIYFRKEDWKNCVEGFERLLNTFPEAPSAAESTYHLGLCRARLGQQDAAVAAWHDTQARFPDTPWAKYAGERLAEVKQ